jgi:hypothetical protein
MCELNWTRCLPGSAFWAVEHVTATDTPDRQRSSAMIMNRTMFTKLYAVEDELWQGYDTTPPQAPAHARRGTTGPR